MQGEREAFALIVVLVVSVFFVMNRAKLTCVPRAGLLAVSFGLLVDSLVCSMVEVFAWEDTANLMQHALASASAVVLAIWSWLTFVRREGSSA